jgi:N-acetylmuramoyl-L-alanine amidase
VVPTRTTDKFITLERRALIARRSRADLLVSIHADWIRKRHSTGATLYIARSPSSKSIRAADCIAAAFRSAGIKCNGIRRRDFRVLVEHPQPAVLIECGYMSNWADARRLNSPAYRTRLVEAITDGIATHFTR